MEELQASISFLFVVAGVSVLGGLFVHARLNGWDPVKRIAATTLPFFASIALGAAIVQWHDALHFPWNSARIAPSSALMLGYPLYPAPGEGPVLGMIYGPVMALAYIPPAFCDLPSTAILSGSMLTSCYFFFPIVWLLARREGSRRSRLLYGGVGVLVFVALTHTSAPMRYAAYTVHADAPALCLSSLSFLFLYHKRHDRDFRAYGLCAACAALAVWTKQNTAPLLVALPIVLLMTDGVRACLRLVGCLAASVFITSLVFTVWFGFDRLWFNLFTIPARHPWLLDIYQPPDKWQFASGTLGRFKSLIPAARNFGEHCVFPLALVAIYAIWRFQSSPRRWESVRNGFRNELWPALVLIAIFLTPTAFIGRVKMGGDVNSLSFNAYFLAFAATLIVLDLLRRGAPRLRQMSPATSALGCIALGVVVLASAKLPLDSYASEQEHPEDTAAEYLSAHRDGVWFPWHLLVHLFVEQKVYHYPYGVFDREIAGFGLDHAQFMAHTPPNLKMVAFLRRSDPRIILRSLPHFKYSDPIETLPNWLIFRAPEAK